MTFPLYLSTSLCAHCFAHGRTGGKIASPALLYVITFIVMTYPFVFRMHDSLPIHNTDTFEILAKSWSLREALIHGRDLDHNHLLLLIPCGLDALFPYDLAATALDRLSDLVATALYSLVGDPFAYNLLSLLGILLKAYGMYLLGLRLFRERIPLRVGEKMRRHWLYSFSAPISGHGPAQSRYRRNRMDTLVHAGIESPGLTASATGNLFKAPAQSWQLPLYASPPMSTCTCGSAYSPC